MKIHHAFRFGLLAGLGALVALGIGAAITSLATILTYIGAALFLALGFDPLVTWLETKRVTRPIAVLMVLVAILAVFSGLVLAIIPVIVDQVANVIVQAPAVIAAIADESLIGTVREALPWLPVDGLLADVTAQVRNPAFLGSLGGGVLQVGIGALTAVAAVAIVLILMLYFIASMSRIKDELYLIVPASQRDRFREISEQISESVGRYVVGQATLAFVNGVLTYVVLTVFVHAHYSVLFAFIAFIGSLLPLVGTASAAIVITFGSLLFNGSSSVYWVAGFYLVYLLVEVNILSPRIMRRAVKVPGAVVVIAALAGGTLLGVLGALVAIPIAASILIIVQQVVVPRQNEL